MLDAQGNQLSTYEQIPEDTTSLYQLAERVMYGSSRLGINTNKVDILDENPEDVLSLSLGNKLYEMSNHLGNVLTVINDIKAPQSSNSVDVDGYLATIVSTADYSPFGVQLDERTESAETYRFGFIGAENDNEVSGQGNSQDHKYRSYDPRLGRYKSVDPLAHIYVWNSTYAYAENDVIRAIDLEGRERLIVTTPMLFGQETTRIRTQAAADIDRKAAEAVVFARHPQEASRVGVVQFGGTNISSVSGRMARHVASGGNMTNSPDEGSERGAFRHVLWQAMITNEFDAGIARRIGNAHEAIKIQQSATVDFSLPLVQNLQAADEVVDFLNNDIGRNIAAGLGENATSLDIAKETLKVQRDEGFWTVQTAKDGTLSISKTKITQKQYEAGIKTLNTLDENGFNEAERKEVQGN